MERQYIGARYVPKFSDPIEWDNQRTYEALTIVTYLGASYTSKKAVPAGVMPTDTNYWVVTGNYNAQVEEYRQNVVQYSNEVESVKNNAKRNVKDFGAAGNGVADDTNAIKAALSACNDGDVLYFPAGTYVCDDSIALTKVIHVMGAGIGKTILTKSATPISGTCVYARADNCKVSNLTVDGNKCGDYGILAYSATNLIVENVVITNRDGIGVGLSNCYRCILNNVNVDNVGNLQPAFYMGYDTATVHGHHTMTNCTATDVDLDGVIVGEDYVTIKGCIFKNCGKGTPTSGALGACGIYSGDEKTIKGIIIDGCMLEGNSESGIDLCNADAARIINNTSSNNGLAGIVGVINSGVISGNICFNNGNNPTTANPTKWLKAGIGLRGGNNISIFGNRCYDFRGNNTQTYGIQIEQDGTTVYDVCVVANNLKYNKTDATNFGTTYPSNVINGLVYEGLNS